MTSDIVKKYLKDLAELSENIENSLRDGKLTLPEIFGIAWDAIKMRGLINDGKEIAVEWQNATTSKKQEWLDFLKDELDLENDRVESLIEKGLNVVLSLLDFYEEV